MKAEYKVGRYDSVDEFEAALTPLAADGWILVNMVQGSVKLIAVYAKYPLGAHVTTVPAAPERITTGKI